MKKKANRKKINIRKKSEKNNSDLKLVQTATLTHVSKRQRVHLYIVFFLFNFFLIEYLLQRVWLRSEKRHHHRVAGAAFKHTSTEAMTATPMCNSDLSLVSKNLTRHWNANNSFGRNAWSQSFTTTHGNSVGGKSIENAIFCFERHQTYLFVRTKVPTHRCRGSPDNIFAWPTTRWYGLSLCM